ncbi:MAG: PAS domain-containing protein [Bacteroidia bacterium]|nr:PAS domain-containing protein [Bacteroidia bacterium]
MLLESSLEHLQDGWALFDAQLRGVYLNSAGSRLLGIGAAQFTGQLFDALHPEGRAAGWIRACAQAAAGPNPVELTALDALAGQPLWSRISASASGFTVQFRAAGSPFLAQDPALALLEAMPHGILVAHGATQRFIFANTACRSMLGYSAGDLSNLRFSDLLAPADLQRVLDRFIQLSGGGSHACPEVQVRRKDSSWMHADIYAMQIQIGGQACVCGVIEDTGDRRRNERLQAAQGQIMEMISKSEPLPGILHAIVSCIEELTPHTMASVLLLDEDGIRIRYGAAPRLPDAYNQAIEGVPIGPKAGSCGTAMHTREPVVVTDIETDPLWDDYRELARQFGLRACWSTPIVDPQGGVLGSFAMYYTSPRSPEACDLELIRQATHLAYLAIDRSRRESAILNAKLHAEAQQTLMQESQKVARIGYWQLYYAENRLVWSPEVYSMYGLDPAQVRIHPSMMLDWVHPEDRETVEMAFHRHLTAGDSFDLVMRVIPGNDQIRYIRTRCETDFDETGSPVRSLGVISDVTPARLAEEALLESEAKYRSLIEALPVGIIALDEQGHIALVNQAMTSLTGYTYDDLNTAESWMRLIYPERQGPHPDHPRLNLQHLVSAHAQDRPLEARIRCKDGQLRNMEIGFMATGKYQVATFTDVTERHTALAALRAERDLFSEGPVFTIVWVPAENWPVAYVSENVAQILGYTPEEMRSPAFHYADLIHPEDLPGVLSQVQHNIANRIDAYEKSLRLRVKSGEYRWFYDFTKLIRDESGQLALIRGYLFDQTNLRELESNLHTERQRLDTVITGTNTGTWEWNIETGETVFNERWAEMVGYTLSELEPVSIETWKQMLHPEDLLRSNSLLARHFRGELDYYEMEGRMRHRDGSWIWVLDRGKVSEWSDSGKPLNMTGTHQDITSRKLAESAVEAREKDYQRLFENMAQGVVYHNAQGEIIQANPAAVRILGLSYDQIVGRTSMDTRWHAIRENGAEFRGEEHPAMEALRTGQPVRNVVMGIHSPQREGYVWLLVSAEPEFRAGEAAPFQVFATFTDITEHKRHQEAIESQNRILRDIAWTQSHVVRAPLATMMGLIHLLDQQDYSSFSEPELRQHLSAKAQELDQIVKQISDKTYSITAFDQTRRLQAPSGLRHQASQFELLLVDDDPLILKLHKSIAVKAGLHPDPQLFERGGPALEYLRNRNTPAFMHLILLDINMPGMSGWEFLDALRHMELACGVAVAILTSSVDISDRIRAQQYPAVIEYLTKPVSSQIMRDLKQHPRLTLPVS